jgi:hypothetical protein
MSLAVIFTHPDKTCPIKLYLKVRLNSNEPKSARLEKWNDLIHHNYLIREWTVFLPQEQG